MPRVEPPFLRKLINLPMLHIRSTIKPTQQSYNIGNIGSHTTSGILETTNDARIFKLLYDITIILGEYNAWIT